MKKICRRGCTVAHLSSIRLTSKDIAPRTVRSVGQFLTQRLFYICGGRAVFTQNDGKEMICEKGDIVYLPPNVTYVCHWDDSDENEAILVKFDLYLKDESALLSDEMLTVTKDTDGSYLKRLTELTELFHDGRLGYMLRCQSILLDVIYTLIPELIKLDTQKRDGIYIGILYIEDNNISSIDVNAVARMCSMCPSAFRAKFREVTGMSPIQYKNYHTMKRAAELLRTGSFMVSEVAESLNIDNIYYFNRMFKKYYGMPPGKYRDENRYDIKGDK